MPTPPPRCNIIQDLDSVAQKSPDFRRRRFSDRLYHIGNTIYIVDLKYNSTILDFDRKYFLVLPHDYGGSVKRDPHNLRLGSCITGWQRQWMHQIHVYYHNHKLTNGGTHPAPGCLTLNDQRYISTRLG